MSSPALAQTTSPPLRPRVSWVADGIVTGAGVAITLGALLIPGDATGRWQREPLALDQGCRGDFSAAADSLSDGLAMVTIAVPLALQTSQGFSEATAERFLIYGETLSVTMAIGAVSKVLVARPRPYVYSSDPRVQAFTARQGKETHSSFYSNHAAMTFAAGVAGSFLFTQTSDDEAARATVWGVELFTAGLTAGLRVRAGRHFPSDVVVGTLVGATLGVLIPYLHYAGRGIRSLSTAEAVTAGVAPVAGIVTSALWPLERDLLVPLEDTMASVPKIRWSLMPWAASGVVGVAGFGEF